MNVHGVVMFVRTGSYQLPTNRYVLEETVLFHFKKKKKTTNIALELFL